MSERFAWISPKALSRDFYLEWYPVEFFSGMINEPGSVRFDIIIKLITLGFESIEDQALNQ